MSMQAVGLRLANMVISATTITSLNLEQINELQYAKRGYLTSIVDIITRQGNTLLTLDCTSGKDCTAFSLTHEKMKKILSDCTKLQNLKVELLQEMGDIIATIAKSGSELKSLTVIVIKDCAERAFNDSDAATLMKGCPNLTKLHIEGEVSLSSGILDALRLRFAEVKIN